VPVSDTLFADIDSMAPDRFVAHLADDVAFRFGNADPVHGRSAVRAVWAGFCDTVDGVRHDLVAQWDTGDAVIAESDVTYTRKDGGHVTVPVVTIYRPAAGLIEDYRVFIDLVPLFAES
jgi:ketosteroid isomerase-like protein